MNNPQNKMINGPVNVLRLEGEIDKIKKVIYLFMDFHMEVWDQYQCENMFNIDVQTYLTDAFTELNKQLKFVDFFVEIYASMLTNDSKDFQYRYPLNMKQKYIAEIFKLTQKMFVHDSEKNKVGVNELFKKIRLHYMDIRDYFTAHIWNKIHVIMGQKNYIMSNGPNPDVIAPMINILIDIVNQIDFIIKSLANSKKATTAKSTVIKNIENDANVDPQTIEYLSDKVRNKYNNTDIKKKMNSFIDELVDHLKTDIDFIVGMIGKLKAIVEYLDKNPRNKLTFNEYDKKYNYGISSIDGINITADIINLVNILNDNITFSSVKLTDMFLLRRFLDKKYITNAIAYTGAQHSANYVDILVKNFGFRVTHASYSKIKDMAGLNEEIKKRDLGGIEELVYPEILSQCSNLESFPKNFE